MRLRAHLTAWDGLDKIHCAVQVYDDALPAAAQREPILSTKVVLQGTGEDDVRQWLVDILVAVVEAT